jgi:anti-sigma regulatory factor (Ser/Thr protein kinase)
MPVDAAWAQFQRGVVEALSGLTTVDGVTHAVLQALVRDPLVVRAGIALSEQGGRVLRFCPTDSLAQAPTGVVPWCEIDGMADVPLVGALLTGSPVLLEDLDALGARYPHLLERQAALGTRALAALPLKGDAGTLGAMLISLAEPTDFSRSAAVLMEIADRVAAALVAAGAGRHTGTARPAPQEAAAHSEPNGSTPAAVVLRLPAGAVASRQARRLLRQTLSRWEVGRSAVETAELCLSEMVTNAVIHSGTPPEVVLSLDDGRLRVVVRDGGPRWAATNGEPQRPPQPDLDAVGGRGLLIVEHLAETWSYEQTPDGTTASFEVLL